MVICAVRGCSNRTDIDKQFSYFRFPGIKRNVSLPRQELQRERRQLWIQRINRSDFGDFHANISRVCSAHFISGRPCDLLDKYNPDWAPSLNLGYGEERNTYTTVTTCESQEKIATQIDAGLVTQKEITVSTQPILSDYIWNYFEVEEENEPETILPDLPVMKTSDNEMLISDELLTANTPIIKLEIDSDDEILPNLPVMRTSDNEMLISDELLTANIPIIKQEIDSDDEIIASVPKSYIENKEETKFPQNTEVVQKSFAINSFRVPETASENYFILPPSSGLIIQDGSGIQSYSTDLTILNNPISCSASHINLLPGNQLPGNSLTGNLLLENLLSGNRLILPAPLDPNSTSVKSSIISKNAEMQVATTQACKCTNSIETQVNLNDSKAIQDGKVMYCSADCLKKINKMKMKKNLKQYNNSPYMKK